MASLAQEEQQEMPFEERGHMVEQIVDAAYDLFSGGLVAKWDRTTSSWYEGGPARYAIRMSDYFTTEPYNHTTVRFSPALIQYLLTRITLPPGVTFETEIDGDIPGDPRTGELNSNVEHGFRRDRLINVVERRFRDRLDQKEYSSRGDDPTRYKPPVESRAPTPTPRDDRAYFEDTGFESIDLIEQELKKIYPPLLEPVRPLRDEDKMDIQRHRNALVEVNNGAYEAGKIVLKDRQINVEQEEIDWINAHGGMSEEEYVLALEKKDDKDDDDVAFLNKFCNENGYNDWEDAYETLKEDFESGADALARAEEKKAELNQEKAELQQQAAMTEEVVILMNDYATPMRRTYVGAYAIESAHQLNKMITGKLKRGAMKLKDERIPRLQQKLQFATAFYEGIDQIFKDDDTVPPTNEWRENNHRSPLVDYVVWGMANPRPGVDKLLFKPQATYVRRLIRTGNLPPLIQIQYMILTDRLGRSTRQDILDVKKYQADAYKNRLLGISPKREQKPPALPGTVERRQRGRSLERMYGGDRRANQDVPKKQKKRQPKINMMPGMKTAKAHTPRGSPTANDDANMKVRSRSRTPVGRDTRGGSSSQTTKMLNKLNLKF